MLIQKVFDALLCIFCLAGMEVSVSSLFCAIFWFANEDFP
jgi:hypothetical protein